MNKIPEARPASASEQMNLCKKLICRCKQSGRREAKAGRRLPVYLLSFSVFLILLSFVMFAGMRVSFSARSFPNIYAGSLALGGMTEQEALAALLAAGWEERASAQLKVKTYYGLEISFDPVSAGILLTADEAAEKAVSYGHDRNIFISLFFYLRSLLFPVDINAQNTGLRAEYIQGRVAACRAELESISSRAPYYVDEEDRTLVFLKTAGALRFDADELCRLAADALTAGKTELVYKGASGEALCPDFRVIAEEICQEAADARFPEAGHRILPEKCGIFFDPLQALSLWEAAEAGDAVRVPLSITEPELTAAELEASLFRDLLGVGTTKCSDSNGNNYHNVRLAASAVSGTVLYPGEEFSFNATVGMRTKEAGYLMAAAYAGYDDIKDEIGGGVCQVSTGIYTAALFSFLDVTSRTCHIHPSGYTQLGTDAAVSIPESGGKTLDLRIRNSRSYPVRIVSYCEEITDEITGKPEKMCTVEIWGTLEESDYMPLEFDNTYGDIFEYDRLIAPAQEGREGVRIKLTHQEVEFEDEYGMGVRTLTHRKVYSSSGELVEDEIINPENSTGYAMDTYYYRK